MSGYVRELYVSSSSSSKNELTAQLVKMITVGGTTKGDSPCRGRCWASHMCNSNASRQMSLQYVLCHLSHSVKSAVNGNICNFFFPNPL